MSRVFAALVLAILLFGTVADGGFDDPVDADFRAVNAGGHWYAFDRGDAPAVDGIHRIETDEAASRSSKASKFWGRNDVPVRREPVAVPFIEVFGSIRTERSTAHLTRRFTVQWLMSVEPKIYIYGAAEQLPDGTTRRVHMTAAELLPAHDTIAAYMDEHYPSRNLGVYVPVDFRTWHRFVRSQWGMAAFQLFILLAIPVLLFPRVLCVARGHPRVGKVQ